MKKLIIGALIATCSLLLFVVYTKSIAGDGVYGASSVALIAALATLLLFCVISLLAYGSRRREMIARIWLSALSALAAYLVIDAGLGLLLISQASPPMLLDEVRHHRLAPNRSSEHRSRDYSYSQRVNRAGLRGAEIEPRKREGTYRILMLGDSFTMGKGVGDDQTFSALLQAALNRSAAAPGHRRFEVLNGGVDSYSPILSYLQLVEVAGSVDPDLVVLNLDMSDLLQEAVYRRLAKYGNNGQVIGVRSEELGQDRFSRALIAARNWVDSHLYISRLVRYYIQKWAARDSDLNVRNTVWFASTELLKHTLEGDELDRGSQWKGVFESIASMKNFCDSRGIRFLMTVYPWGHQVSETEWIPQRWDFIRQGATVSDRSVRIVEDFAEKNSIALLNVFGDFRAYNGERPLYFSYDMHWTQAGHELMARKLHRYISELILPSG